MPHDLFGDVLVRPRSARPRQPSVVILSIAAHSVAIAAIIVAPLFAPDALPAPQQALRFFAIPSIVPPVPVPPLPRSSGPRSPVQNRTVGQTAAPREAPSEIRPETGNETNISRRGSGSGVIGSVDDLTQVTIGLVELPQPPPAPRAVPVRLHVGIRTPQKLVEVPPIYPPAARIARVEGVVIIDATIDEQGNVVGTRVRNSAPLLEQAALEAVKQWKFTPTLLNGVPVPVIMTVTVKFTLR